MTRNYLKVQGDLDEVSDLFYLFRVVIHRATALLLVLSQN
nr:hypothetical protein [uncultured bacterium]